MIFEIIFTVVGLGLIICSLGQRAEIRSLQRERKRLLLASKYANEDIEDSKRQQLLAVSECDILRNEAKRLEMKLEKSRQLCERLWESNTELTKIVNRKGERELPTFEF